jgi:hypothetical protein
MGILTSIGSGVIGLALTAVFYFLQYIASQLFVFATQIAGYFLAFNFRIMDPTNSIVQTGWQIVRDIANLGFVLVIIIMAVATIIRVDEAYGAKKLLPKLIAAAILINFSLAIAGVFINFSHTLTNYFFAPIAGSQAGSSGWKAKNVVNAIGGAFQPQALFTEPAEPSPLNPEDQVGAMEGISMTLLMNGAAMAFTTIFTLIAAFVMFTFGLLLLVRFVYLSFLLIIVPIVWLFWVFPALSGQYSKWWSNFLNWVFFAPAAAFFFYVALVSINELSSGTNALKPTDFFSGGDMLVPIMMQGGKMILLAAFLIGGLMMAQSMGGSMASSTVGFSQKMRKGTQAWLGKKGGNLGRRALSAGVDDEGKTTLERWSAKWNTGKITSRVPLVGRALTGLSGASSKARASLKSQSEEYSKKYASRTGEDAAAIVNREKIMPAQETAAVALRAAEERKWDKLTPAGKKAAIAAIKNTDQGKKLLAFRPELATEFNAPKPETDKNGNPIKDKDGKLVMESQEKFRTRVIGEAMAKVDDVTKLDDDVLADPAVAANIRLSGLTALGDKGSLKKRLAVKKANQNIINKGDEKRLQKIIDLRKALDDQLKAIDDTKDIGPASDSKEDNEAYAQKIANMQKVRNDIKTDLKTITKNLDKEQGKALANLDAMSKNVAYREAFEEGELTAKDKD